MDQIQCSLFSIQTLPHLPLTTCLILAFVHQEQMGHLMRLSMVMMTTVIVKTVMERLACTEYSRG